MRLWSFILVLALATLIGTVIRQHPGYALFSYGNWAIEMPLWVSAILLIILIAISVSAIWFVSAVFSSSSKIKQWWNKHQKHTARLQTYRGLLALTEGRWKTAERYLIKSAAHSDTPLINYLSAAQAAEECGATERRDQYLQVAFDMSADSEIAVRLTQAQLQLKHGDFAESIHILQRLHKEVPKHTQVLRLLCILYEAMQDWASLLTLLPALKKWQALPKNAIERLEQKLYPALLPQYVHQDLKALQAFWHKCPKWIQANPIMIYEYAKLLTQKSADDEAESLIRFNLKKMWNTDLIHLYGLINGRNPSKQLAFAESLLPHHETDPILLLTVGKLCLRNQLWGKARDYLETSLTLAPLPETYAELGQLMEQLGQPQQGEEYFKKGLLTVIQSTSVTKSQIPNKNSDLLCLSSGDGL